MACPLGQCRLFSSPKRGRRACVAPPSRSPHHGAQGHFDQEQGHLACLLLLLLLRAENGRSGAVAPPAFGQEGRLPSALGPENPAIAMEGIQVTPRGTTASASLAQAQDAAGWETVARRRDASGRLADAVPVTTSDGLLRAGGATCGKADPVRARRAT